MRTYAQLTKHHILYELDCAEGWALYAYAVHSDPFSQLDFDNETGGYIAQHRAKLLNL